MKKKYILLLMIFCLYSTVSAQLIINEVLYDPPSDIAGDANGDGVRSAVEDEFIEFINNSESTLDVSGYKIFDVVIDGGLRTKRHTIPENTILPANGFLVVFGGGMPKGSFGGATVIADIGTAGLSLGNSGEKIEIENAAGTVVLTFDSDALSNNPDESYTRTPDITGNFVQHEQETDTSITALFSPGTYADGSVLSNSRFELTNVNIYPNPISKENSFVTVISPSNKKTDVIIYNVLGGKVKKETIINNKLNISSLSKGLYLLKISQENRETTKKILIR